MAEIRKADYISRCPSDVLERAKRRGMTRLIGRVRVEDGEKFFVSGKNDNYEVYISQQPTCSCPDWGHPCKHLSYIYLDVLRVPTSSPIWWQTALLQSEVDSILPPQQLKRAGDALDAVAPKKQRVYPESADEDNDDEQDADEDAEDEDEEDDASSDIQFLGMNAPNTTIGLKSSTVRGLVLNAVNKHPICVKYIDALRPTVVDGLSEDSLRQALIRISQEYPDVAAEVHLHTNAENAVVYDFVSEVADADNVIHSLDGLRESQKFSQSYKVTNGTEKIISRILKKVTAVSHPQTRKNAIHAFVLIGEAMFGADGEINKALVGYGEGLSPLCGAIDSVLEVMHTKEKAESLPKLRKLAKEMSSYGHETLQERVEEIQQEVSTNE
ncbi:hypothetical protein Hypma_013342 [Hypsizygus marmoreus]|uniref:SWIM-type domain-containing protein n=1 Tax=Hypsizygus marmoreus TaxID=39966 RepID=A0A369JE83_HYPMA|nr:hypothetical protein Hypma_013342 [Hypsizygus marmoreus]